MEGGGKLIGLTWPKPGERGPIQSLSLFDIYVYHKVCTP